MRVLVVSDSHLFFGTEDRERSLVALLRSEDYDVLILLGDMYDFWYEYRSVVPKYAQLFTATVINLAQTKRVHYVSGNHDAWIGDFWRSVGVKVHRFGFQRTLFGRRFLFTHGDYLFGSRKPGFVRAVFHSRWANFLFSLLHPDLGVWLATRLSHESRRMEERFNFSKIDRIVSQKSADVVVSGHLHIPILRRVSGKIFACPGDWMFNFTYLKVEDGRISVRRRDGSILSSLSLR
ncbi:MAG: UDP-2,3-diacylglucosamine diphosphatase [Thermotogae bacterium]|nr:UDP-2,3-diacylglucosamine diphosphatase [Thermotogota bacterium]